MTSAILSVPALNDTQAQLEFFKANSYVPLPGLLTASEVAGINAAIDRDRKENPFMWYFQASPNTNCQMLLTEPIVELAIRQPVILDLVNKLMGGAICFEEISIQITEPSESAAATGWHRDRPHRMDHPLHLDYPQAIYYLTDVDESTHCFTLSPEPADGDILAQPEQLQRGGVEYFYGRAGSAILFNSSVLHGLTRRKTARQRRILQVYYGHPGRAPINDTTIVPPRLWRDHADPEIRRFYSKHNRYSSLMQKTLGISGL